MKFTFPKLPKSLDGISLWGRISLRTRLTAISVGVIALLLSLSLGGTMALLKTYLQQNTDSLLLQTATTLASEDPTTVQSRIASAEITIPPLPGDYYIAFLDPQGQIYLGLVSAPTEKRLLPNLSQFNVISVQATHGTPFTAQVTLLDGTTTVPWRLVALPDEQLMGSVVVGLPLEQNEALIDQYRLIGLGFSGFLLFVSALALWLTISSALRPLREVSAAADAVRKGKFDSRLPKIDSKTELADLNNSLNEMLDSIEGSIISRNQTLDRMKQFVADASHELRTPLVSLRGYAELYRKGAFKSKAQVDDAMSRIESEALRMSSLVESLLALTRLDNQTKLQLQKADIVSVSDSVIANIKAGHPEAKIALQDTAGKKITKPIEVKFDDAAMRQILTNLLNNAVAFAGEKPIEVVIKKQTKETIIEVVDHGEGIAKQLRSKVFERFYRSDNSRHRDSGGSGLGLAIVKGLVEGHGGKIVAEETAGGGATFIISLPN